MGKVKLTGLDKVKATIKKKLSKQAQLDILEEIGDHLVQRTVDRILNNEVKPKTTSRTLEARRTRKRNPSKFPQGTTLADNGDLYKSIQKKVYKSKM